MKQSFGFIGITFICVLIGGLILNDLIKLVNLLVTLYEQVADEKRKAKKIENEKRLNEERERQESLQMEIDKAYSLDLEEKLEKFHIKLIKAVASSRKNINK